MKSKKEGFTIIAFPVFSNYLVHVEVAGNLKEAMLKYPDTRDVAEDNMEACAVHISNATRSFLFLKPNASVNTITHESWHVVRRMLKYMGCEYDNETYAYHLGYLAGKVHDFVKFETKKWKRIKGANK